MYVKIHISGDRTITAISDEDLIGKNFSEGKLVLDVNERFYKGKILSDKEVIDLMNNATNLNIVGKKAIALAIKNEIITQDHIIMIQKVPHAQVYGI